MEFAYNHNGLRTQKKVAKADGTVETTDYTLHGKLVTHLRRGNDAMHFFYDNEKHPVMVDFNGARYSYVHNPQGDIVGIVDAGGSLVVEYKYDAWGKPVLVRTLTTAYETLAEVNPFRYRGYVYDEETGLYYLRSRYYCHVWSRFLSGDLFLGRACGLLTHTSFIYCGNRPISRADTTGYRAFDVTPSMLPIDGNSSNTKIKEYQRKIYGEKFADYRKLLENYDVEAAIEHLAPPGGKITETVIYDTVLIVNSDQRRGEAFVSTIVATAIGSLAGLGGALLGAIASLAVSYVLSGKSSTPPDGTYGAVVLEATIELEKTVIGGYDENGNPFPTTIKTEETFLAYYYFDAGEHNDNFVECYIPTNDPRFW